MINPAPGFGLKSSRPAVLLQGAREALSFFQSASLSRRCPTAAARVTDPESGEGRHHGLDGHPGPWKEKRTMEASRPPVANERDGLMVFLEQQRGWVRAAAYGLDETQARATPTRSSRNPWLGPRPLCGSSRSLGRRFRLARRPGPDRAGTSGLVLGPGPGEELVGPLDLVAHDRGDGASRRPRGHCARKHRRGTVRPPVGCSRGPA
jgi:hypothetical protein